MSLPSISTYITLHNNGLVGSNNGVVSRIVPSVFSTTSVIGLYDVGPLGFEFLPNTPSGGIIRYRYELNSTTTLTTVNNGQVTLNYDRVISQYIGASEPTTVGAGVDIFTTPNTGEGNIAINTGIGLTKLFQNVDPITKDAAIRFYHGDSNPLAPGTYIDYSTLRIDSISASTLTLENPFTASTINILSTIAIYQEGTDAFANLAMTMYDGQPTLLLNGASLITANITHIQTINF